MNKRGFTLVELLSVVIILSLLIAFVLPQITNSVRNYQVKTDEVTTKLIIDAAKLYVGDNSNKYPKKMDNSYCITMNELIENDYLKNKIKLNDVDVTNTKSVQVTYDTSFNYELVDTSECIYYNPICEPVTEDTVTSGNIPEGTLESGDEYICEVKPGEKHHFFVVSTEGDTISLIMDRNICEDGGVAIESNTCLIEYNSFGDASGIGPVTAIDYLNNATNAWNNITNLNIIYDDEGTNFTSFEIIGKARLPYRSEVGYSDGNNEYLYGYLDGSTWNGIEGKQPTDNISGIKGYWTFSSNKDDSSRAYYVNYGGSVSGNGGISSNANIGIRPVIELNRGNFPICTLISGEKNVVGSKYVCDVAQGKKYNFYVLSHEEDGTTNLIMDRNINSDGTMVTKAIKKSESGSNAGIYNLVAWVTKEDYNDEENWGEGNNNKGPITAMNFLETATKSWISTNEMLINSFSDDLGEIYSMEKTYNTHARLPYESELNRINGTYLYDYLADNGIQENPISDIGGYWTFTANSDNTSYTYHAWTVNAYGTVGRVDAIVGDEDYYGVRPVINLKL